MHRDLCIPERIGVQRRASPLIARFSISANVVVDEDCTTRGEAETVGSAAG